MEEHEQLKQAVFTALENLFGDDSVDEDTTKDSLLEVREEIDIYLSSL